jgi:hypothetical protein
MKIVLEGEIEHLVVELIQKQLSEIDIFDDNYDKIGDQIYRVLKEAIEGKNIEVATWFQERIKEAFLNFTDFYKEEVWDELNPEFDEMKDKIRILEEKINLIESELK